MDQGAIILLPWKPKRFNEKHIFNPGNMESDELAQEFCGSCHQSAEKVLSNNQQKGVIRVRFQPYRLFTSRGHDPDECPTQMYRLSQSH